MFFNGQLYLCLIMVKIKKNTFKNMKFNNKTFEIIKENVANVS